MIEKLKHFFIPHKHNDFKPGILRELSVSVIVVTALALLFISSGTKLYIKNTNMTAEVLPAVLVDLTNNVRKSDGEVTLVRSSALDEAAKLKAEDMASSGYFAHTSPAGVTPWHWFSKVGYNFYYAGENLAIDFDQSEDVENAWLNSPSHKANILNGNFTEIGIATKEGFYNGHSTVYVVQMFGKPVSLVSAGIPKVEAKVVPQLLNEKVKSSPKQSTIVASNVKGESVASEQNLKTISNTKEFISVKNIDAVSTNQESSDTTANSNQNQQYSTWYQRLIFLAPLYTDTIYKVFIWIILISLLLMTIIEIRRQHPKNIMYGVCLIVIILCLIYINRTMFAVDFLV